MARLSGILRRLMNGEHDPDILCRGMSPRGTQLVLSLIEELARVRERRYALDAEELAHDLCCVAVPVSGPSARVSAGISIAMPKARFKAESVAGWVLLLNETATRISGALGLSGGR